MAASFVKCLAFTAIWVSTSESFGSNAVIYCQRDEFKCKDGKQCVNEALRCNGVPECDDRSDEEDCVDYSHCEGEDFFSCNGTSKNGKPQCINPAWVCDGYKDCEDGSDESSCPEEENPESQCKKEEFRCKSGLCIPAEMMCDDIANCFDASDEEEEVCKSRPCKSTEFRCETDKKCIPQRWRCDDKEDCTDGADESGCRPFHSNDTIPECANGTFTCDDLLGCIPLYKVCDGSKDCQDGSDETEWCKSSCDDVGCEDSCQMLPKGKGQCVCTRNGYELGDDGRTCKDVDECQRFGACSQRCVNLPGSFQCSCHSGYVQTEKGCKAENQNAALLFFAGKTEIKGVHLHNMKSFTVTDDREYAHQAIGIAFDALSRRVFWTDVVLHGGESSITSSAINGTAISRLPISDLVMPEGLALDHVTRNIYFSESIGDYVGVCNVDTDHCTKLSPLDVSQPRELALYVPEGLLFYSDWGYEPRISRMGMDGTNHVTVIKEDIHWPNGVAVDIVLKRIFWSEAKYDRLESALFDGTDRRKIEVNFIRHPFSLAVFEDRLFWSDWEMRKIQSCNKFDGSDRRFLLNETTIEPMALHVYHPVLEKQQRNPCRTATCSHICLMSYGGKSYTCKCPTNMYLSADAHTCKVIYTKLKTMVEETRQTDKTPSPISLFESTTDGLGRTETSLINDSRTPTINNVTEDTFAIRTLRNEKSLGIGLGIAGIILVIVIIFIGFCVYSSRKNRCEMSPVLRYKNPAFGYEESSQGSDDVDIFIERIPDNPPKNPDLNFTENFQAPVIESLGGKCDDTKKNPLSFPSWRPRANDRYYKL